LNVEQAGINTQRDHFCFFAVPVPPDRLLLHGRSPGSLFGGRHGTKGLAILSWSNSRVAGKLMGGHVPVFLLAFAHCFLLQRRFSRSVIGRA
jgi:hypothetical protein